MALLNSGQLPQMAGGREGPIYANNVTITDVVIDSRKAIKNCLFVALKGEHTDGHDYVAKVVAEPTNFALVNSDFQLDLPNLIRVDDSSLALGLLAANYRKQFNIPVAAITGSNGKTTVKEMLRSICEREFSKEMILATTGNLNNHLGMPLTLLQLSKEHKVAIIEMGMNHSGELTYLSNIAKPTLAAVNNVMFAHAGHFTSIRDIANAKFEIFTGLTNNGLACIDKSSEFATEWQQALVKRNIPVFMFGSPHTNCYIKELNEQYATYITPLGELTITLKVLGRHNYINALTVIALAVNMGCSLDSIKLGLEEYTGYKGRLERKTAFNGALIIDDSYNANPDSVKAALEAIQVLAKPYWFIFADLKELGEFELDFHAKLGKEMNQYSLAKLLTVGDLAKHAARYFEGDKIHFANNQDIVQYCLANLPENATVLIKGSQSMHLSEVVQGIISQG